jgi:hypothetical protein
MVTYAASLACVDQYVKFWFAESTVDFGRWLPVFPVEFLAIAVFRAAGDFALRTFGAL